jgi:acyl-CoA dehydrogenase
MDFELSEEHRVLRDVVAKFVERELIPLENQLGPAHGPIPPDVLARLQARTRELGLWLLDTPEEYGGAGLDLLTRCIIAEQVGRTTVVPWRSSSHIFGPEMRPVLRYCNDEQKERFLFPVLRGELRMCFAQTEPDAGSDPGAMRTRAVQDGDDYVINGTKRFISGAGEANLAQVMAATDPTKRSKGGITCFIVPLDSPGIRRTESWPTIAGESLWEISFEDVRVPATNIIGGVGEGFAIGQRWLSEGRIRGHGARSLGVAQRSLEMMTAYSQQRVTFGQPLSERQAIQFMISDSAIDLHQARLLVYECAWRYDRGEDVRDLSFMVKIVGPEMATRVVDRAIQVHGGMGVSSELPLEWWHRQLRATRITEGPNEVLRWRLAKGLMSASRH